MVARCTTTTTNGSATPGSTPLSWSPRSVTSAPSSSTSSSWSQVSILNGPAASRAVGCALCGSHFTQSQSAWFCGAVSTAIRSSSGAWKVTSCPTMALTSPTAATGSPANSTLVKLRRPTAMGMPVTVR